ncbi:hypothetical protein MSPP1_003372 [Malassezia sp. CBS 17886]|nr:hypothetical protein MSPP1_003372 [Malassezia sp. CBS 17886]
MLADRIQGQDYLDKFDFFTDKDPTNGLVNYQSEDAAKSGNLSYVSGQDFIMRVDTTEEAPKGRNSVRLQSKKAYGDAVVLLEVSHVPTGCAVWPAFWTVTSDLDQWPKGGEIDIMENVNDQYAYNLASVHVQNDCMVSGNQTGTTVFNNCNAYANDQSGCRIAMNQTGVETWGSKFNSKGGGVVAMQRDFSAGGPGVRMWIWDKGGALPPDVAKPGKRVDPNGWGTPMASFGLQSCADQFGPHNIVFDITLCGDWAGPAYANTSCPSQFQSCSNQVGNKGSSFIKAYWQVRELSIFTPTGASNSASTTLASAFLGSVATAFSTLLALV